MTTAEYRLAKVPPLPPFVPNKPPVCEFVFALVVVILPVTPRLLIEPYVLPNNPVFEEAVELVIARLLILWPKPFKVPAK